MDLHANSDHNNLKRKRKMSNYRQLKKKMRKSEKRTKVDNAMQEYFFRVYQLEHSFEGSIEEKITFANNALAETDGKEVECSFDEMMSRVIESLLPFASTENLEKYFEAFGSDLRPICVHYTASHVLQALMIIASRHSEKCTDNVENGVDGTQKHSTVCKEWLLKVSKYLLNNIEEFMWESCANPVLRTAIFCLAGIPHLDKHYKAPSLTKEKQHSSADVEGFLPPEEFLLLLEEYFGRISTWPQFEDFVNDPLTSGYLQCLLQALRCAHSKQFKVLSKKILSECFSLSKNPSIMSSPIALPVLEVVIEQGKTKMKKKVYEELLSGRISEMACDRVSNITLQKFVNSCSDKEVIAEIVTALKPKFQDILAQKHDGVLVSLCQACERLKTSQTDFFQALLKSLNCQSVEEPQKQLVHAVLSLVPLPHESVPSPKKSGSLLMQSLLKFQKPIKLAKSLLLYEPKDLADLFSSTYGSYIAGAFCKSEFIGEKSRQKLIRNLMGYYSYLAQSKFGSRSFDDIWDVANEESKEQILSDLNSSYSELKKTNYGQFVASKVMLEVFRTDGRAKWNKAIQSRTNKSKKEMFARIIGDVT